MKNKEPICKCSYPNRDKNYSVCLNCFGQLGAYHQCMNCLNKGFTYSLIGKFYCWKFGISNIRKLKKTEHCDFQQQKYTE